MGIQHLVHACIVWMSVKQIDGSSEDGQKHIKVVRHHLDGHAEFAVEFGEYVHSGALTR